MALIVVSEELQLDIRRLKVFFFLPSLKKRENPVFHDSKHALHYKCMIPLLIINPMLLVIIMKIIILIKNFLKTRGRGKSVEVM